MLTSKIPRNTLNPDLTRLARILKNCRIDAGMTQQALADASGVGLKVIRTLEQGNDGVSLEKLMQLLDFLGLEIIPVPRKEASTCFEKYYGGNS